jgi:selenocysteine-specific elongation factor
MREIILGTAGHVDHGKTSLIRALTGIDTDRLKEEKERGITIELGFAFLDLPSGHRLGIVDVPGHEKFIKNMVAGAAGMDLVAFIIAADEGIMPQTREHLDICRLLGLKRGLIVITKTDMVEPDWLEMVEEEVRDFFTDTFLADAPLLKVSSTTGEGIDEVRATLDTLVENSELSEAYGPFRLPVDRVFTMKGFGAVITGTSISGRISVGDEMVIYPQKHTAKVRGIQVHGKDVDMVEAGHRTAINLQGIDKEMINRGNIAATPDSLQPSYLLDCDFHYLSPNKKKLKNRTRVRVHLGTAEVMGRIVLLDHEELAAGENANVQILLEELVTAWPGDHYVIRSYSPVTTIGGGTVFNGSPPKRRRFKQNNTETFRIYRQGTVEEQALAYIRESSFLGLTFDQLATKTGIFGKRLKKIIEPSISRKSIIQIDPERQLYIDASIYENLQERIKKILTDYHLENPLKPGLAKEELRTSLYRGLNQKLFQHLLKEMTRQNTLVPEGAVVRLATHQVSLKEDEEALQKELQDLYLNAGLKPPTRKEMYEKMSKYQRSLVDEVLAMVFRNNILTRVTDDLFFHSDNLAALQKKMIAFLEKEGEIDAPRFKNMTGLSRKFTIPLLEYFDRQKLTIRVGDKRVLRK